VVLRHERCEKIDKSLGFEFILVGVIELGILLSQAEIEHLAVHIIDPEKVIQLDLLLRGEELVLDGLFQKADLVKNRNVDRIIELHVLDIGDDVGVFRLQVFPAGPGDTDSLDLILEVAIIGGTLHLLHAEMNGVRKEPGKLLARQHALHVIDQVIGLFFGLVEINLLFEIDQLDQGMHPRIFIQRDMVLAGKLDKVADISDQFRPAFLERVAAADEFPHFFRKHETANAFKSLVQLRKDLLIPALELEGVHIGFAVLFVKLLVLHAIKRHNRLVNDRQVFGPREAPFPQEIVRDVLAGIFVRKERKKFGVEFAGRTFKIYKTQLIFFGKITEDIGNVALGFFVDVRILDMEDNLPAIPLKRTFDRSVAIGKIGTINQG